MEKIEIYCWCSFSALYYVSSKEKKKNRKCLMARLLSSARDIVPSGGTHKIIYSRFPMFLFLNKTSNSVEKSISTMWSSLMALSLQVCQCRDIYIFSTFLLVHKIGLAYSHILFRDLKKFAGDKSYNLWHISSLKYVKFFCEN